MLLESDEGKNISFNHPVRSKITTVFALIFDTGADNSYVDHYHKMIDDGLMPFPDWIENILLWKQKGMISDNEYDYVDSGRNAGASGLWDDANGPFDGSWEVQCGAEIQVGSSTSSLGAITTYQKIAQQTSIKGRYFIHPSISSPAIEIILNTLFLG